MKHLDCICCRKCGGPMAVINSRPFTLGPSHTKWRSKKCKLCGDSYRTVEVPLDVAKDVWEVDE